MVCPDCKAATPPDFQEQGLLLMCATCRGANETAEMIHFHSVKYASDQKKPWAAKIVGVDSIYTLKREFLNGLNDYTNAATFGKRAVDIEMLFTFRVGWVVELYSPSIKRAYYQIVSPTEKQPMTAKEVLQWALNQPKTLPKSR